MPICRVSLKIVHVYKKNRKLRVCSDPRDFNKASSMDAYLMPIVDLFVDATSGHKVISFMDVNEGYKKISRQKKILPRLLLVALRLLIYMNSF